MYKKNDEKEEQQSVNSDSQYLRDFSLLFTSNSVQKERDDL